MGEAGDCQCAGRPAPGARKCAQEARARTADGRREPPAEPGAARLQEPPVQRGVHQPPHSRILHAIQYNHAIEPHTTVHSAISGTVVDITLFDRGIIYITVHHKIQM